MGAHCWIANMTRKATNLVLEHLHHTRSRVDSLTDDLRQVILRLGSMEGHVAELRIPDVDRDAELDRPKSRLDRVEWRLELADG
jgi:hypothetical protein